MPVNIWFDVPRVADPPERAPRTSGVNGKQRLPLIFRLRCAFDNPNVWYAVAEGPSSVISPYATAINSGKGLPNKWEAVTRQEVLYVRYLGDFE